MVLTERVYLTIRCHVACQNYSSLLTKLLKVCVLLQDLKSEQTRHFPGLKEKAVPCPLALLSEPELPVVAVAILQFQHDVMAS